MAPIEFKTFESMTHFTMQTNCVPQYLNIMNLAMTTLNFIRAPGDQIRSPDSKTGMIFETRKFWNAGTQTRRINPPSQNPELPHRFTHLYLATTYHEKLQKKFKTSKPPPLAIGRSTTPNDLHNQRWWAKRFPTRKQCIASFGSGVEGIRSGGAKKSNKIKNVSDNARLWRSRYEAGPSSADDLVPSNRLGVWECSMNEELSGSRRASRRRKVTKAGEQEEDDEDEDEEWARLRSGKFNLAWLTPFFHFTC